MPFNVVNPQGHHLGVVVGTNTLFPRSLLVAVTQERLSDESLDLTKVREELSGPFGCRGFMKINEEKLDRGLEELWEKDYQTKFGYYDPQFLLRLLLLSHTQEFSRFFSLDASQVNGYVALSRDIAIRSRDELLLDADIEYIQDAESELEAPVLLCRVIGYPVATQRSGGIGRYSYLEQETKIRVQSGNVTTELLVPMQLYARQGLQLSLTWRGDKIKMVQCDGMIYSVE